MVARLSAAGPAGAPAPATAEGRIRLREAREW